MWRKRQRAAIRSIMVGQQFAHGIVSRDLSPTFQVRRNLQGQRGSKISIREVQILAVSIEITETAQAKYFREIIIRRLLSMFRYCYLVLHIHPNVYQFIKYLST